MSGGEPLQTANEFVTIPSKGEGGCEVLFLVFMNNRHIALSGCGTTMYRVTCFFMD